MRQFVPEIVEVPGGGLYDDLRLPADRGPYTVLGMVTSVDGATTLAGTSRRLGGAADLEALLGLRSHADVILVGAETVRAEDYGPPSATPRRQEQRAARGQSPFPRLAIVSATLELDPAARVFSDPQRRPIVLTTADADPARRERLEEVADVLASDDRGRVDLPAAIERLAADHGPRLVCEGGPALAGQLVTAGLVRELFLTVAATLVGGEGRRVVVGVPELARPLRLVGLHTDGIDVLLRYRLADG